MRIFGSVPFSVSRVALSVALAAGVAFAACDVDAQSRGGKPSMGSGGGHGGWQGGSGGRGGGWHGGSGGRGGGWHGGSGGRGAWHGGNHSGWRGGDHGRHWDAGGHGRWHGGHGHHWRGHHGHGWHGGRYYYPGWALGLGVGIGLTYPWWGWGYPYYPYTYPSTVVYERVYDAPAGVVVDRDIPVTSQPVPAYRWYCPSPPGYHPDVPECGAGWLKVLPPEGGAYAPPSGPPPSTTPRSSAPADDAAPASRIAPGTIGTVSSPMRIAAPRMTPPAQIARGYATQDTLAQNATQ